MFRLALGIILIFVFALSGAVAEGIKVGGTGGALGYLREVARGMEKPERIEIVVGLGSSGANRAVAAGMIDLSISGRPLKPAEVAAGLVAHPLMQSAFAFFTSRPQRVNVTRAQVVSLIANSDLPNALFDGERVRPILRPPSDSDLAFATAHFDGFGAAYAQARKVPGIPVAKTDQENAMLAERTENSLATGTLIQMISENRALRAILIDGVEPTAATLASGEYPFRKTFYVVTRQDVSEDVQAFVAYLHSERGREQAASLGALIVE